MVRSAIVTKYLGPTNTKGGRIKATTDNGRYSVTIDYPHESRYPHADAALALCWKMGWTGTLIEGGTADGSVFVFADSESHIAD